MSDNLAKELAQWKEFWPGAYKREPERSDYLFPGRLDIAKHLTSQNVDLATDLLTSHVRSLLHLSGKFSCDYCVLNRSMCSSLWRTMFVCDNQIYHFQIIESPFL